VVQRPSAQIFVAIWFTMLIRGFRILNYAAFVLNFVAFAWWKRYFRWMFRWICDRFYIL